MGKGQLELHKASAFRCGWEYKFSPLGEPKGYFEKLPGQNGWRIATEEEWLQSAIDDWSGDCEPLTLAQAKELLENILAQSADAARQVKEEMAELGGIVGLTDAGPITARSGSRR